MLSLLPQDRQSYPTASPVPEERGQEMGLRETLSLGEKQTFALVSFAGLRCLVTAPEHGLSCLICAIPQTWGLELEGDGGNSPSSRVVRSP